MQGILKEISLGTDEDMTKEPTEMLTKLTNIKCFHLLCSLW